MPFRRPNKVAPDAIGRAAAWIVDAAAAVILVSILATTLAQVGARYLFGGSLAWSEELNRLLFIWMICIAASRASHMRIDYIYARLSPKSQNAVGLAIAIVSVGLLGLLAVQSLDLYDLVAFDRFIALDLSVRTLYLAPIVGTILWIAAIVWRAHRRHILKIDDSQL